MPAPDPRWKEAARKLVDTGDVLSSQDALVAAIARALAEAYGEGEAETWREATKVVADKGEEIRKKAHAGYLAHDNEQAEFDEHAANMCATIVRSFEARARAAERGKP